MNTPNTAQQSGAPARDADSNHPDMVASLRASAPYVHAHRGRTFVIHVPGEAAASSAFTDLIYDIALLASLGVRLVIVFGARPQIDTALADAGLATRFVDGVRVTDSAALACVKRAVGSLQMDIEALLSTSLASTPMGGARIVTASGNLVTARPVGIAGGVDHGHTGEVRRIDVASINDHLERGAIVLMSCVGYSPSGEIFNLYAEEVATAAATALAADKFVVLHPGASLHERFADTPAELDTQTARRLLAAESAPLETADRARLQAAINACQAGVARAHLVSFDTDGALLRELYSRDGAGTMIAADTYDITRAATADDLGGVLALIEPLADAGILVARSREQIELDIGHYLVLERDGLITACCSLMPYAEEGVGELACVAVHPDYRGQDRAERLLVEAERRARVAGLQRIFVLTTKTPHWFVEHGFAPADLDALPLAKRALYNYQRNSAVLIKKLA
ncbi:Amino-acid acetyltransferase protein [Salinisphaera shabanensis E1L3A]|uniref:Amino-acid acetyltransferase n=1 Tax=Salinisphaera shabanensis E1L3A TaxID=1033802 RepID=U2EAX6_9GAMM|nr:amino-acid N-acetyltransferase [Salinisphaera shabanensis]ERJ20806.1 Amino-acid acetyltransferase protein [Salinisphaera shabanensis E1L3A]